MFSSIPGLKMPLGYDNAKFLNTLPDVPWGVKSPLVENNLSRVTFSPLKIWINKIGAPQRLRPKKVKVSLPEGRDPT